MNKNDEGKLEMIDDVVDVLDAEKAIYSSVNAISLQRDNLRNISLEIKKNEATLKDSTIGKTESKYVSEDELVHDTVVVAGGIYAYASTEQLTDLKVFSDVSRRDFRRMRDTDVPVKAKSILDKADELGDVLIPYGITQDLRDELRTDLTDYSVKVSNQGTGVVDKSAARSNITALFKRADIALNILDKLMKQFLKSNPEFYNKYKISRNIWDKATRHTETSTADASATTNTTNNG